MTAPIRRIIDEEVAVLIENIHKSGNRAFGEFLSSTAHLRDFADALEQSIGNYHLEKLKKEVLNKIVEETSRYQDELIKKERELSEVKTLYKERINELQARNKRLHDEIKRLQKKVRELEKNPLTERLNESISNALTNELVKHLNDEITFLRTLLLRR